MKDSNLVSNKQVQSNFHQEKVTKSQQSILHIMCGYQYNKAVNQNDIHEVI